MSDTQKQFSRVQRALARVEKNKNRVLEEYEDDIWCFFQNCWHLKDWVKNDGAISIKHRDAVEKDVRKFEELKICEDLANRSKHLKLTRNIQMNAEVKKRNTIIFAGPPGEGYGKYEFKIQTANGREFDAIEVAKKSVEHWETILRSYGVDINCVV